MNTTEYQKISIEKFSGLYARGMMDECPQDHAITCNNLIFSRNGECTSRPGRVISIGLGHTVRRQFLATFDNARLILLTLDDTGNIYADSGGPILSIPGMTDFVGLNLFNHCFILPVGVNDHLKIWDGTNPVRDACGIAPTGVVTATDSPTDGEIDVGDHRFAVSFVTNTGFTTPPSPLTTYTAPGGKKVIISNIPTGPSHVVARIILATKSNLLLFFYAPGGRIEDNSTTTITLDFQDTDLAVSADGLFDTLPSIISAGSAGYLEKYEGRLLVLGGEGDLVRVSDSGQPESFNTLTGYIQVPSEFDGNVVKGVMNLRRVLYFTKSVGIYTTADNDLPPASWPQPSLVDGSVGAISHGIGTITSSQNNLDLNDMYLLADSGGLYVFDGIVRQPPLTYKIDDIWKQYVYPGVIGSITVYVDPFQKLIYICITGMPQLMVADYNEGLTPTDIKWSLWAFPNNVKNIGVFTYKDVSGFGYFLRLSFEGVNGLYKLQPGATDDSGVPIQITWKSYLATFSQGGMSIFRGLKFRMKRASGAGTTDISLSLSDSDGVRLAASNPIVISNAPGKEYLRETNFISEKAAVVVSCNDNGGFTLNRLDIFGKEYSKSRPA